MKLITRDTDYALRALCFIVQQKGKVVPVNTLVKELSIPRPFLRKILQTLNKKGMVFSHKGKGGGFSSSSAADKIYLLEVMRIFQGALKLNECLFKKAPCPNRRTCKLKAKVDAIEKYVIAQLKDVTLKSLL